MLKKVACVYAVIIGVSASSALAVPTVRKVGNTVPGSTGSSLAVTSRAAKMPLSTNTRIPIIKQAVQNIKVGSGKTNNTTPGSVTPTPSSSNPATATEVSEINERVNAIEEQTTTIVNTVTEDLTVVTDKVATIEEQTNNFSDDLTELKDKVDAMSDNFLTGVEAEDGTYVTDVTMQGKKLHVSKRSSLLAPVKNGNSETITGNAEIWIVK